MCRDKDMGSGTIVNPYTLKEALASADIKPGHTVYLRGGNYTDIPYYQGIRGTAEAPIYFKPYHGERPIITGRTDIYVPYTEWWGVEFCKLTYDPRDESDGACDESTWLDIYGGGNVKIINCIIHDFSYGVNSGQPETELNGCIIYHCGWEEEAYTAGHGVYVSNADPTKTVTIKNCIIFNNWGWGIHAYSELEDVYNIDINGNICFNAGYLATWGARRTNIMLGVGSSTKKPINGKVRNNCSYFPLLTDNNGIGLQIGFGTSGSDGLEVTNNYSAGGAYAASIRNPTNITVTGNTFIGGLLYFDAEDYADNTYAAAFPEVGSKIVVYPLDYQADRVHVAIYNWALANTVDVDLTSVAGLSVGDSVKCHNAQDYFTDIQTLTLDANKKITVNMQAANRTVATPVNWTAPATTFPQFGAFVVEKI